MPQSLVKSPLLILAALAAQFFGCKNSKNSLLNFSGSLHTIIALPAALNCPDKDAAQILSLRILVLIFDWLRDAAMTLYYGSLRHVPRTNRAGELVSCEAPGIPWRRK